MKKTVETKKEKAKLFRQVHLMNSFFSQVTAITGTTLNQSEKVKLFNLFQTFMKLPSDLINRCRYVHGAFLVREDTK